MKIAKLTVQGVGKNPYPLRLLHFRPAFFSDLQFPVFILQCSPQIANFALLISQFALIFRRPPVYLARR
jgi:hypothetical protein